MLKLSRQTNESVVFHNEGEIVAIVEVVGFFNIVKSELAPCVQLGFTSQLEVDRVELYIKKHGFDKFTEESKKINEQKAKRRKH